MRHVSRLLSLLVLLAVVAVPVMADTHESSCEERIMAVERAMEDRMEDVSSEEERRQVINEFEARIDAIQADWESASASSQAAVTSASNASAPAPESPTTGGRQDLSPRQVVGWSHAYPDVSPINASSVSLSSAR